MPAVETGVEKGSVVRTDAWQGYLPLASLGYKHLVVRKDHSVEYVLSLVNTVASLVKRWLTGTHQGAVRPSHLDYDLVMIHFPIQPTEVRSRGNVFYRLVQQEVR